MAGQLQQLAAHVRGYSQALTHSDRVCQHLSSQVVRACARRSRA
ncbi:hypothetical protein M8494_38125 (plasmid) [Serratia ureilytica]